MATSPNSGLIGIPKFPKELAPTRHAYGITDVDEQDDTDTSTNDGSDQNQSANGNDPATHGQNPDNHDWAKRYADLKSYTDKTLGVYKSEVVGLKQELDKVKQQLNEASKSSFKPPKSEEEIEAFKGQYPELYNQIVSIVLKTSDTTSASIKQQLEQMRTGAEELEREKKRNQVRKVHSDLDDIIADTNEQFWTWYSSKTAGIQNLFTKGDVSDVVEGLNMFKAETGQTKTARPDKDASRAVNTPTTSSTPKAQKTWTESEIQKMSQAEFERLEDEILKAMSEGRVQQDITSNKRRNN